MKQTARVIGSLLCVLLVTGFSQSYVQTGTKIVPKTVDEAVSILKSELSPSDRDYILRTPRDRVQAELHFPAGMGVRNRFKMWGGQNPELMKSCGVRHPDDCSWIIFGRLWDAVRAEADPDLVKRLDCQFQLMQVIHVRYASFIDLTTGEMLQALEQQINKQMAKFAHSELSNCQSTLKLHVMGDPNLGCFARTDFATDSGERVKIDSLDMVLGWIAFRNEIDVVNDPPQITLKFKNTCAWPKRPKF